MYMLKIAVSVIAAAMSLVGATAATAGERPEGRDGAPALVVTVVAGGLPYDFFTLYGHNLSDGGLRRFMDEGLVFTEARYEYMPTNSASSLAAITTGSYPCVNGVVGEEWHDVLTGARVGLIEDEEAVGLNSGYEEKGYSGRNLLAPTLGDRLLRERPGGRVLSVAADPVSAVVMAGLDGTAYWFDDGSATWTSSNKYMLYLPGWVTAFNAQYRDNAYLTQWFWSPLLGIDSYVNRRYSRIETAGEGLQAMPSAGRAVHRGGRYGEVLATPLADELLADFVRQAVVNEELGAHEGTDMLNICFDALREVVGLYGPESVEAEDAFYRLDRTVASLMRFIELQCPAGSVLFVFTSDHGTSRSYDAPGGRTDRFNPVQFRAIANSFLCATYGGEDWIEGYCGRRLYIDRSKVLERDLELDRVQRRVSDFALQFRGLSRVVPSSDLRGGDDDGYMQRLRNGYYQKRSGDLLVDLEPGMIEEREGVRSAAGSAFDYDTHVPLMMTGCGVRPGVVDSYVDMASLPAITARILRIQRPEAATAGVPEQVAEILGGN